jgi:HEAT repeat protein
VVGRRVIELADELTAQNAQGLAQRADDGSMSTLDPIQLEKAVLDLLWSREAVPAIRWRDLGPRGLTKLYALSVSPTETPQDDRVRGAALATLGRLGALSRIHAMFDALADGTVSPVVRCGAIEGLGLLRHPRALAVLQSQAFHSDHKVRLYATAAMGRIGTAGARRVLADVAMRDPHHQVKRAAQAEVDAIDGPTPIRLVQTA